jgi:uncharacterized protein (UPF0332 family)
VTPEAADYLDKARDSLDEARKIGVIGLARVAARAAYYAAFHTAEAFIVERTGKIAKTHSGVRSEFARLARKMPEIDRAYSIFLAKAYKCSGLCGSGRKGAPLAAGVAYLVLALPDR